MGLMSPGGENLLDCLELRQVLSTYDGDLRDPLWWPQEWPIPKFLPWTEETVHGLTKSRTRLSNFT